MKYIAIVLYIIDVFGDITMFQVISKELASRIFNQTYFSFFYKVGLSTTA